MVTSYLDDIVKKIIQDRGYTYEFVCEDRGHDATVHADTYGIFWSSNNTGKVITRDGAMSLYKAWDFGVWKSTNGTQMVLLQGHGMPWSEFPNSISVEVDGHTRILNKNLSQKEFPAYTIDGDVFNLKDKAGKSVRVKISW